MIPTFLKNSSVKERNYEERILYLFHRFIFEMITNIYVLYYKPKTKRFLKNRFLSKTQPVQNCFPITKIRNKC